MAHLKPIAEYFAAYHVETNEGTEIVPEDLCGRAPDELTSDLYTDFFADYVEGSDVESYDRKEGWYGRLSAPGYLDATDWMGPYKTDQEALDAVKEQYDVDDEGEPYADDDSSLEG